MYLRFIDRTEVVVSLGSPRKGRIVYELRRVVSFRRSSNRSHCNCLAPSPRAAVGHVRRAEIAPDKDGGHYRVLLPGKHEPCLPRNVICLGKNPSGHASMVWGRTISMTSTCRIDYLRQRGMLWNEEHVVVTIAMDATRTATPQTCDYCYLIRPYV